MMMKTTTTTISQKSILSPSRRSRSSFKGKRSAFGEQSRGRIFCSRQDDDDFGHHHHRMTTTKRKREKKKKGGMVCFSCADEEEEALLTTAGGEASTLTSSLLSSFHLRDTDETRARVRKGAARTKSERESSRSRATVSPPLLRPSSKRRREKAFCLFGETRFIRFK